jgi:hypothetical protein
MAASKDSLLKSCVLLTETLTSKDNLVKSIRAMLVPGHKTVQAEWLRKNIQKEYFALLKERFHAKAVKNNTDALMGPKYLQRHWQQLRKALFGTELNVRKNKITCTTKRLQISVFILSFHVVL